MAKLDSFRGLLGDAFQTFDRDGSGGLDRLEYATAQAQLGMNASFAVADVNRDGQISREELVRVARP